MSDTLRPHGLPSPWNSPGDLPNPVIDPRPPTLQADSFTSWVTREAQEYWSGEPIPSSVDLPDPGTLHCRQVLYQLSYQENSSAPPKKKKKKKNPSFNLSTSTKNIFCYPLSGQKFSPLPENFMVSISLPSLCHLSDSRALCCVCGRSRVVH